MKKGRMTPPRIEGAVIEDRFNALQRGIEDRRISGRLTEPEARELQDRLDAIRSDYLNMTKEGRYPVVWAAEILFSRNNCSPSPESTVTFFALRKIISRVTLQESIINNWRKDHES
jgi:hypothetical protein